MRDDSFYAMFNAHHEPLGFKLPEEKWGRRWAVLLNTADEGDQLSEENLEASLGPGGEIQVQPWSMVLLKRTEPQ